MQIYSLGKVTPGSTTPAVINTNAPTLTRAAKVSVLALTSNAFQVFVGTATMDISSLAGVVAILNPGDAFVLVDEQSTEFQLDKLYVLAQNGSDAVLVSGYRR